MGRGENTSFLKRVFKRREPQAPVTRLEEPKQVDIVKAWEASELHLFPETKTRPQDVPPRIKQMRTKLTRHFEGEERLSEEEYSSLVEALREFEEQHGVDLSAPPVPGWPRPFLPRETKEGDTVKTPLPWLTGNEASMNNWGGFDNRAVIQMYEEKFEVCNVCGERLGEEKVFARVDKGKNTSAAGGLHPKCALMTLKHCPHYKGWSEDEVFMLYQGEGHGIVVPDGYWQKFEDGEEEVLNGFQVAPEATSIGLEELKRLTRSDQSA